MPELHPHNGQQTTAKPHSIIGLGAAAADRPPVERASDSASLPNGFIPRKWEMFLIWSFVAFTFAAFFFWLWAVAAKCEGNGFDSTARNACVTTMATKQIENPR